MKKYFKKNVKRIGYFLSIAIVSTVIGFSLQLAKAWIEPSVNAPNDNVGAPLTTGNADQTKTGGRLFVKDAIIQAYSGAFHGSLNYANYGGYFYNSGGVYAQNTSGYYAYLGYPGSSYGVYTNGNVYGYDYYVSSVGRWVSSMANGLQLDTWQGNHYSASDGREYATIFYDTNNSGYYVDPNSTSRLNYGVFDNVNSYGWMQAPYMYDSNNNNYYVDPNAGSRVYLMQPDYSFNGLVYDYNNAGYYLDPNSTSRLNYGVYDNVYSYSWMQAPYMLDADNNGYYVDPASTSVLNAICAGGDCSDYLTHDGGGYLRAQGDFRVTNQFYNDGSMYSQIMYDSNNGAYYVDPAGASNMNNIYTNDVYIRATGKWASETSTVRIGNAGITLFNGATAFVGFYGGTEYGAFAKYENGQIYTRIRSAYNVDTGWIAGTYAAIPGGCTTGSAKTTATGILYSWYIGCQDGPDSYGTSFGPWQ
jgi:hypothetical protein